MSGDWVRRHVAASLVALGALGLAPAAAHAGAGAATSITYPATVAVGQTGRPASITVRNANTPPQAADTNGVCDAGDAAPPCAVGERGIVLTPACYQVNFPDQCAGIGADPGVFALSATGVGRVGTACASTVFNIAVIDPTFGTVRFTPQSGGSHVLLPGAGSACTIDFTFDVVHFPAADSNAMLPGIQTAPTTAHTQWAGAFHPGALSAGASGRTETTFLQPPSLQIATTASPSVVLGGSLSDSAIVSNRVNPGPGTIQFSLYGPGDATCSGSPVFTSNVAYPVSGGPVASATFTPAQAGTYRWIARYSGDVNNPPVAGTCNDPNESTVVLRATPTIATTAAPGLLLLAGRLTDSATVSGRVNPLPGATITFRLYAPAAATCSGTPVFASPPVSYPATAATVTSPQYQPTATGTYRWTATYSGDANNAPVAGACNAPNESSLVILPIF